MPNCVRKKLQKGRVGGFLKLQQMKLKKKKKVLLASCFKSFEFLFAEAVPACDIMLVSRVQQKKEKKSVVILLQN